MPDKSLEWIKEVDFEDLLDKDAKLIHEWCGTEVLIALWQHFASMSIYVSTKPLDRIKKRYIKKHCNGSNIKELCSKLNVSERFIYDVLEERGIIHEGQERLC